MYNGHWGSRAQNRVLRLWILLSVIAALCVCGGIWLHPIKRQEIVLASIGPSVIGDNSEGSQIVSCGLVDVRIPRSFSFEIVNTEERRIEIVGSHTSCGCLSYEDWVTEVPARSRATASGQINATRPGPLFQSLWIETDSNVWRSRQYDFVGIGKGIWTDCKSVELGDAAVSTGSVRRFNLFIAGHSKGKVDRVHCTDQRIDVVCTKGTQAAVATMKEDLFGVREGLCDGSISVWDVQVAWRGGPGSAGRRSAILEIHSQAAGVVTVPVTITANEITLVPATVLFDGGEGDDECVRQVIIRSSQKSGATEYDGLIFVDENGLVNATVAQHKGVSYVVCKLDKSAIPANKVVRGQVIGKEHGCERFRLPYVVVWRQ